MPLGLVNMKPGLTGRTLSRQPSGGKRLKPGLKLLTHLFSLLVKILSLQNIARKKLIMQLNMEND